MKRSFRMITLKLILSQMCLGDWFMSLDLKDAYFHIQAAPHHRRFLRFAFERVAYQLKVLPFGLSLAPRTFTRCMNAALSPLRPLLAKSRRDPRHCTQKEGCHDRRFHQGFASAVRGQTNLRSLVRRGVGPAH